MPVVLLNLTAQVSLAKCRSSSSVRILVCFTSIWNAARHPGTCWTVGFTQTCRQNGFGGASAAPDVPRSQWENDCIDWSLVSRQTRKQHKFTGTVDREMEGLALGGDCGNRSTFLCKESMGMVEGKQFVVTDGAFSRFPQQKGSSLRINSGQLVENSVLWGMERGSFDCPCFRWSSLSVLYLVHTGMVVCKSSFVFRGLF